MSNFKPLFIVFFIWIFSSCKDIIEPSIENKTTQLLAPSNKSESNQYQVNFWIEPLEDALYYRFQIVSPNFDSINKLIADTLITSNKFSLNIDPGTYQWRARAENGSSRTNFSSAWSFNILLSSITAQKVQIKSPANNLITNQSSITFKWDRIFGADNYRLQIDTANFIDETKLYYNQSIPGFQSILTFNSDKNYQWRVRAESTTEQSKWSDINSFKFDHTPPLKVILVNPVKDQQVVLPVSLQWNSVSTARNYKLYIYKSDSTTLYDSTFPVLLTSTSYSFNKGLTSERIYWKVSAVDEAGNEGEASELRSFIIN
ncbi:fibronectin type III domain-containing protein [Daejeonella oryzae]|uniref:hypothetical protein n=1 Tax=Daejeonella oryzae TaxID=1122943 RepID=UPI000410BE7B|nr:hypothetical protein [Daejeonella oryzae]